MFRNSVAFGLLAFALVAHSGAAARADDSGEVNLLAQFSGLPPAQVGGTCHIFAATAIFEAACFRKTGAHVDLSEGVLYAQHLDRVWKGALYSDDYNSPDRDPNATLESPEADVTGMDGGNGGEDLHLILSGVDCTDESFLPLDNPLLNPIEAVLAKYAAPEVAGLQQATAALASGAIDHRTYLARRMAAHREARLAAALELERTAPDYLTPGTYSDPAIQKCLSLPMKVTTLPRNISADAISGIIDQGQPVLCGYRTTSGSGHAVAVLGHRKDPATGKTELLIRNSEDPTHASSWMPSLWGCLDAWTLN